MHYVKRIICSQHYSLCLRIITVFVGDGVIYCFQIIHLGFCGGGGGGMGVSIKHCLLTFLVHIKLLALRTLCILLCTNGVVSLVLQGL